MIRRKIRRVWEWWMRRCGWRDALEIECAECGRTVQVWVASGKASIAMAPGLSCMCGKTDIYWDSHFLVFSRLKVVAR